MTLFPKKGVCTECKKGIVRRSRQHHFCSKACYKRWRRKKNNEIVNPLFCCPSCSKIQELKFNPKSAPELWRAFGCSCGFSPYKPNTEVETVLWRAIS